MKKILIIIGYKKREFEYVCLFSSFLNEKEFSVKIRYANFECYKEIFFWQPDIVVIGQVNQKENIELAKYSHHSGSRVVVLNCEGTYDDRKEVYRFGKHINHYVDFLIAWGLKHKEDALKYSDIDERKIVVCGTPKFDFYIRDLYKRAFETQHKKYRKAPREKKVICISTSYASADNTWEKLKNNYVIQQLGRKTFEHFVACQRKLRDMYIDLAIELQKTKKYVILFRPHPLEPLDYYKKRLGPYAIPVDNAVYPAYLFLSIDLLIHRSSTLATEGWIVKIPTVSYDPLRNSDKEMLPFTQHERVFSSLKRLMSYIMQGDYKSNAKNRRKQDHFLEHWFGFHRQEKTFSSEKLVSALQTLQVKRKQQKFHPYVIVSLVLDGITHLFGKEHSYEVIAIKKGRKYEEAVRENYINESDYKEKIKFFRKLIPKIGKP